VASPVVQYALSGASVGEVAPPAPPATSAAAADGRPALLYRYDRLVPATLEYRWSESRAG